MNVDVLMNGLKRNIGFALLISAFSASLLLNVKLGLTLFRPFPPSNGVRVGSDLRTIPTVSEEPNSVIRTGGDKPTLLYIMAPECPWCAKNLENIRSLSRSVAPSYNVVGISNTTAGLAQYLAVTPLPFQVFAVDLENLPEGLDPGPTPQLVLIGANGKVERVWRGALAGKSLQEVESFFHLKLPGFRLPG